MATEIKVPALGEGVEGGKVISIEVAAGDSVSEGQTLLELETGKATVEVPSPADGVIESLSVSEDDELSVGDLIGSLAGGEGEAAEDEPDSEEEPADHADQPDPADEGESDTPDRSDGSDEGEEEEDSDEGGESSIEVPALGEGVEGGSVVSVSAAVGDEVKEGDTLFELETGKATVEVPAPSAGKITGLTVSEGDEV